MKCNDYRLVLPGESLKCWDFPCHMVQWLYSILSLALFYTVDTCGEITHADPLEKSWNWWANSMLIKASKNCIIQNNPKLTESDFWEPGGGFNPYALNLTCILAILTVILFDFILIHNSLSSWCCRYNLTTIQCNILWESSLQGHQNILPGCCVHLATLHGVQI